MKIMWVEYKQDISDELDRTTWIEMMKEILILNHDIKLILPSYGKRDKFGLGDNIVYLSTIKGKLTQSILFSINLFFYSVKCILTEKPDVVLFGFLGFFPLFPFIVFSKIGLIKTKFVLDIRAVPADFKTIVDRVKDYIYAKVIYFSKFFINGITVISSGMKKQISDDFKIKPSIIGIWSSGVSKCFLDFDEIDKIVFHELDNKQFVIMYHGIITSKRGLQETLNAIKIVKNQIPGIIFFILGDGIFKPELQKLIKNNELEQNIILHSPVKYELVPQFVAKCDVGILPFPDISWWNTSSPLKLFEYLACGKPVIVTNIEAHREVLNNSPSCFFIDSNDPAALAEGIIKAYKNKNQLKKMGIEGQNMVKSKYTWKMQAEKLINYFEKLKFE